MSELIRMVLSMSHDIKALKACVEFFQKLLLEKQEKAWLDDREAAKKFHVNIRKLQRMRQQGQLPFTRFCNKTYYRKEDLEDFLKSEYSKFKNNPHGSSTE